jgi:4-hydroxybenzoate polyprenyltransferase
MINQTAQQAEAAAPVLVVDLDGTLLKSDLLLESLLFTLFRNPLRIVSVVGWLLKGGRALLKERLAGRGGPEGILLPWNQGVVDFCSAQAREGRQIVLATASNEKAASAAVRHFPFVSQVIGSDDSCNLKAERKAARLVSDFGSSGFDYVGDSAADLPVWKVARKAWFVGSSRRCQTLERRLEKPLTLLAGRSGFAPAAILKAVRPHQWLKNLLIFVPLLAAHRWSDTISWELTVPVFLALCCMASGSYLLNDLSDLDADRRHLRKKARVFANGQLGLPTGLAAILVLLSAGIVLAATSSREALVATLLYFLFSALYSLVLKTMPVFDTLFLSGLYTYRIVLGGIAASVFVSPWLLAFSTTFFLGLAFLKRYVELDGFPAAESGTVPGRGYTKNDLVFVLVSGVASSFLSVVVLALYLDSSASSALYRAPQWLWGIGLVLLFWIIRV